MDDRVPPADAPAGSEASPLPTEGAGAIRKERPLPLRQMGIGEILDAAIKLYRAEWKKLMAIVAIVLVPVAFIEAFATRTLPGPLTEEPAFPTEDLLGGFIASAIITVITLLFINPFLTAAVARAASNIYLGDSVAVGSTYRFALTKIHSILWISLLTLLAGLLGFILLVIPGIIAFVRLTFGSTVLVVEGLKGSKALGRSWRLAKGHFWRLFGVLLLANIMAGVVASILAIPGSLAGSAVGSQGWPLTALGDSLASVLTTPFTTLITVLLYFDLRIRKEGFDIEVMAQELAPQR
jgi:hypothetical protein